MVETSATIRLQAVDTNLVSTIGMVSAKVTNTQIAATALNAAFKGLEKVTTTNAAKLALGARNADLMAAGLGKAAGASGTLARAIAPLSNSVFYLQQVAIAIDGVNRAGQEIARIPQTLQAIQASGISTAIVQDFANIGEAIKGNDIALDSLVTNAIARLGRFEAAATRAGTILRSSTRFDEEGKALRANDLERLENALSVQQLVNGELKNAVTSTAALAGQYEVLSSGFTNAAESQRVLASGSKLIGVAEAGGVAADAGQTLQLLTKTLNAYEFSAEQSASTAAKLNAIVENGLTTIQQLSLGFGATAKQAKGANIALDDLGAAVAVLTAQGVSTPEALTGISRVSANIVDKTPEAEKALAKLQLNGERIRFDKAEIQAKGFTQALIDLNEAAGGSPQLLAQIFPEDVAFRTVNALLAERGKRLAGVRDSIAETDSESLNKVFDIATSDRTKRFERLTNRLQESIIKLGLDLVPTLEPGIKALEELANGFERLPEPVKKLLGQYLALQIRTKAYGSAAKVLIGTLAGLAGNYLLVRTVSLALTGQLGNEISTIKNLITQRKGLVAATLQLFGINQKWRLAEEGVTKTLTEQSKIQAAIATARAKAATAARGAVTATVAATSGVDRATVIREANKRKGEAAIIAQNAISRGKEIGSAVIQKTKEQINKATDSLGVRPFFPAPSGATPVPVPLVPQPIVPTQPVGGLFPTPQPVAVPLVPQPVVPTQPVGELFPAPQPVAVPIIPDPTYRPIPTPQPQTRVSPLEEFIGRDKDVATKLQKQIGLERQLEEVQIKRVRAKNKIDALKAKSDKAAEAVEKAKAKAVATSNQANATAATRQKALIKVQKQQQKLKLINQELDLAGLEYTKANTAALVAQNRVTQASMETEKARAIAKAKYKPVVMAITDAEKAQTVATSLSQKATIARYKSEQLATATVAANTVAVQKNVAAKKLATSIEIKAIAARERADRIAIAQGRKSQAFIVANTKAKQLETAATRANALAQRTESKATGDNAKLKAVSAQATAASTKAKGLEASATRANAIATVKANRVRELENKLLYQSRLAEQRLYETKIFGNKVLLAETGLMGKINRILTTNIGLTKLRTLLEVNFAKAVEATKNLLDLRNLAIAREQLLLADKDIRSFARTGLELLRGGANKTGDAINSLLKPLGALGPLAAVSTIALVGLRKEIFGLGKESRKIAKSYQELVEEQERLANSLSRKTGVARAVRFIEKDDLAGTRRELIKLRNEGEITFKQFDKLVGEFPELKLDATTQARRKAISELGKERERVARIEIAPSAIESGLDVTKQKIKDLGVVTVEVTAQAVDEMVGMIPERTRVAASATIDEVKNTTTEAVRGASEGIAKAGEVGLKLVRETARELGNAIPETAKQAGKDLVAAIPESDKQIFKDVFYIYYAKEIPKVEAGLQRTAGGLKLNEERTNALRKAVLELKKETDKFEPEKGIARRIIGIPKAIGKGLLKSFDGILNNTGAFINNKINGIRSLFTDREFDFVTSSDIALNREADNLIPAFSVLDNLQERLGDRTIDTTSAISLFRTELALTSEVAEKVKRGFALTEEDLRLEEAAFKEREKLNNKLIADAEKTISDNEELLKKVRSEELKALYEGQIEAAQTEKESLEEQNEEMRELRSQAKKYLTEELPAIKKALQERSRPDLALASAREKFDNPFLDEEQKIFKPLEILRDDAFKLVNTIQESLSLGILDGAISGEIVAAQELRKIRDEEIEFMKDGELKRGFRLTLADRKTVSEQIAALENTDLRRQEANRQLEITRLQQLGKRRLKNEAEVNREIADLQLASIDNQIEREKRKIAEFQNLGIRTIDLESNLRKLELEREGARIDTLTAELAAKLNKVERRYQKIDLQRRQELAAIASSIQSSQQQQALNQQLINDYNAQERSLNNIVGLQKQISTNAVFNAQKQIESATVSSRRLAKNIPLQQKQLRIEEFITRQQNQQQLLGAAQQKEKALLQLTRLEEQKALAKKNGAEKEVLENLELQIEAQQLQVDKADDSLQQARFQQGFQEEILRTKQEQFDLSVREQQLSDRINQSVAQRAKAEAQINRTFSLRSGAIASRLSTLQLEKQVVTDRASARASELSLASQLTNSEIKKQRLAKNIADIKLRSLSQQVKLEAEILAYNQQQERIQLNKERSTNQVALQQNLADILAGVAEVERLQATGASDKEIQAASAGIEAGFAQRQALEFESESLRRQERLLERQQAIARESFERKTDLQLDRARVEALSSLPEKQRDRVARQVYRDLVKGEDIRVRNLGDTIQDTGRIKVEVPEIRVPEFDERPRADGRRLPSLALGKGTREFNFPELKEIKADVRSVVEEFRRLPSKEDYLRTSRVTEPSSANKSLSFAEPRPHYEDIIQLKVPELKFPELKIPTIEDTKTDYKAIAPKLLREERSTSSQGKQIAISTLNLEAPINITVSGEDSDEIAEKVEAKVFGGLSEAISRIEV